MLFIKESVSFMNRALLSQIPCVCEAFGCLGARRPCLSSLQLQCWPQEWFVSWSRVELMTQQLYGRLVLQILFSLDVLLELVD